MEVLGRRLDLILEVSSNVNDSVLPVIPASVLEPLLNIKSFDVTIWAACSELVKIDNSASFCHLFHDTE